MHTHTHTHGRERKYFPVSEREREKNFPRQIFDVRGWLHRARLSTSSVLLIFRRRDEMCFRKRATHKEICFFWDTNIHGVSIACLTHEIQNCWECLNTQYYLLSLRDMIIFPFFSWTRSKRSFYPVFYWSFPLSLLNAFIPLLLLLANRKSLRAMKSATNTHTHTRQVMCTRACTYTWQEREKDVLSRRINGMRMELSYMARCALFPSRRDLPICKWKQALASIESKYELCVWDDDSRAGEW